MANMRDALLIGLLVVIVAPAAIGLVKAARLHRRSPAVVAVTPPPASQRRRWSASSVLRTGSAWDRRPSHITASDAVSTWFGAWLVGQVITAVVFAASGSEDGPVPIGVMAIGTSGAWAAYLIGMARLSRTRGSGRFCDDYRLHVKARDLAGIPIGVLVQLIVVPLTYLPLQAVWPDTFTTDRLQDNANDMADGAGGTAAIALVLMIAVGAPIVEELVYRGLVQGALAARFDDLVAWLATAGLFTLIHFRPVEYPGLAAFALVVGAAALQTRKLGLAIAIHIGFNATGLALAYR